MLLIKKSRTIEKWHKPWKGLWDILCFDSEDFIVSKGLMWKSSELLSASDNSMLNAPVSKQTTEVKAKFLVFDTCWIGDRLGEDNTWFWSEYTRGLETPEGN